MTAEEKCPYGTGQPHSVTEHGIEGHPHKHNPLAPSCSRGGPGEPTCSHAVCRTCATRQAPAVTAEEAC